MMDALLVTCEHGGNTIPADYLQLFRGQEKRLNSHYGFDAGALFMAQALASELGGVLVSSTTSRLLIDLNRPLGHLQLYSAVTRNAPAKLRAEIVSRYYQPYMTEVERLVRESVERGRRVVHISSHSFIGELSGVVRNVDVGLLYDPCRHGEVELCAQWKSALSDLAPQLRVRRNYPYHGKAAGLTAQLRRRFSAESYVGIELEVNQTIVAASRGWAELCSVLPRSLLAACA